MRRAPRIPGSQNWVTPASCSPVLYHLVSGARKRGHPAASSAFTNGSIDGNRNLKANPAPERTFKVPVIQLRPTPAWSSTTCAEPITVTVSSEWRFFHSIGGSAIPMTRVERAAPMRSSAMNASHWPRSVCGTFSEVLGIHCQKSHAPALCAGHDQEIVCVSGASIHRKSEPLERTSFARHPHAVLVI